MEVSEEASESRFAVDGSGEFSISARDVNAKK